MLLISSLLTAELLHRPELGLPLDGGERATVRLAPAQRVVEVLRAREQAVVLGGAVNLDEGGEGEGEPHKIMAQPIMKALGLFEFTLW